MPNGLNLPTNEEVHQDRIMDAVLIKACWAHDHLANLAQAINNFFESCPYEIRLERDSKTLENVYSFVASQPVPREISGHVGDVIHNLRSALDHLAWQLVFANGGEASSSTAFPIIDPDAKHARSQFSRHVSGMGQEAIEAIKKINPCKGADNPLWRLHRLDIIDKHHEIIALSTARSDDSTTQNHPSETFDKPKSEHHSEINGLRGSDSSALAPMVRVLRLGDVIKTVPKPDYNPNKKMTLQVSFNVQGLIEGEPVLDVLKEMENCVVKIIRTFRTDGHFAIGKRKSTVQPKMT